ncbi:Ubiquitin-conjugating enzyme E2 1 [Rhodotorula kratochvilovae]
MPPSARAKRLVRELQECQKDTSGLTIAQVGDSLDHFIGSFPGPEGTSYEGGRFEVDIRAPERYPFEPLKMKFITKVYHPNISSASGYICLDILNKSWSPVYTLRTCLVSLQSLLSSPEPTDPQDAEVAKHYLTDRRGFEETARFWTESYAHPHPGSTTHTPGPPSRPGSAAPAPAEKERADGPKSLARLAGLDWRDVQAFADMGFPPERVIDTLKFLNYRDGNKTNVGEEAVVMRLMG